MLKIRYLLVYSTDHFMFVLSFYQQRVKTWDEYASHLIPRIDDSAGRRGEKVWPAISVGGHGFSLLFSKFCLKEYSHV